MRRGHKGLFAPFYYHDAIHTAGLSTVIAVGVQSITSSVDSQFGASIISPPWDLKFLMDTRWASPRGGTASPRRAEDYLSPSALSCPVPQQKKSPHPSACSW